jgi:DNA-binding NarL/FixJ family response regulator
MTQTPDQQSAGGTAAERRPYSVVIVDDHAMFRTGVKAEIGRSVALVGEAADADRAIAVILQTQPDVVLLDVHRSFSRCRSPTLQRMSLG